MWYDDMSVLMILLLYRYLRKVLKIAPYWPQSNVRNMLNDKFQYIRRYKPRSIS